MALQRECCWSISIHASQAFLPRSRCLSQGPHHDPLSLRDLLSRAAKFLLIPGISPFPPAGNKPHWGFVHPYFLWQMLISQYYYNHISQPPELRSNLLKRGPRTRSHSLHPNLMSQQQTYRGAISSSLNRPEHTARAGFSLPNLITAD